jgi:hypothetical protein
MKIFRHPIQHPPHRLPSSTGTAQGGQNGGQDDSLVLAETFLFGAYLFGCCGGHPIAMICYDDKGAKGVAPANIVMAEIGWTYYSSSKWVDR